METQTWVVIGVGYLVLLAIALKFHYNCARRNKDDQI